MRGKSIPFQQGNEIDDWAPELEQLQNKPAHLKLGSVLTPEQRTFRSSMQLR